ncbi:hypothetical protein IWW55_000698 [Coemansia sp. RSA 2706]|nr:hypothetical protein LPJ63_004221 [Coemansia sp. RSA 2711]KAJ2307977.1 hypothetical protein IWW55_000698 [Coemansia sp. RSA 2706]
MSDFYPSMAAHCYYVPTNMVPAYAQQKPPQRQPAAASDAMGVSFGRKFAPKRGRDDEDLESTNQRCTYLRKSVVSISPKRSKAVEGQV